MASRPFLFRVVIRRMANSVLSLEQRSAFMAEVRMPMPMGLVSSSTSPSLAPLLVRILSGWTKPVTDRPYLGSSSKML